MQYFNKYIIESLKTNEINISITDVEYREISNKIQLLKDFYQKEVDTLYSNARNLNIMNCHCNLVKTIIGDVMNLFPVMIEHGACAFLTGSFARCTCKKNSDLDFHIIYFQEYDEELFKYEEIIYYMLSEILNLGRNKIHPMILTKMHPEVLKYLEKVLNDSDLTITIKSNIGEYNYKINANLKRRIYLQYYRKNTIDNIVAYLKKEIDNYNREWAHIFFPITMKAQFNSYIDSLFEYEKSHLTSSKIVVRINNIKKNIYNISQQINSLKNMNIREFKNIYQKKEFELINEYISLQRDICLLNKKDWKVINYFDNSLYLGDDITFQYCLNYMFLLFDITEPLGNRYSLHSDEIIKIDEIDLIKSSILLLNKRILENILGEEEKNNGKTNNYHADSTVPKVCIRKNVDTNSSK